MLPLIMPTRLVCPYVGPRCDTNTLIIVQETKTRFVLRLLMAPLPGLGDHLLCDYEQALRRALSQELAAKQNNSTTRSVGDNKCRDRAQDEIRVQVSAA